MAYYEVYIADTKYRGDKPLTYSYNEALAKGSVVSVPLRGRLVSGFVLKNVEKPAFVTKEIKSKLSTSALPSHLLDLAQWLKEYYITSLGQSLRQFAPTKPSARQKIEAVETELDLDELKTNLKQPLTPEQRSAIKFFQSSKNSTVLLHGDTGSGKTRVYIELAKDTLASGKSVIILTPEIALTSQLQKVIKDELNSSLFVLHSQQTQAQRKQTWKRILESDRPIIVMGPRSALFSPVSNPGLIIVDEAHEPAYKQDQSPRYHAVRVASQLAYLSGARVVLGTATPSVTDYYVADSKKAITRMSQAAMGVKDTEVKVKIIDTKDRSNFTRSPYLSNALIDAISTTLLARKQIILYLNRRGSSRLVLCNKCGWQLLCPNCDIPLVFHADEYIVRCHTCGFSQDPPSSCPVCQNTDIIYKSIGTKALVEMVSKLFSGARIARFDTDSEKGERLHELYSKIHDGEIDILVGTQILAKGLDLPKLGLVGVISAESSISLPDFSSNERSFQLLYQIIGRVGRGHGKGQVYLQSYNPDSELVKVASQRKYDEFYKQELKHRQAFRFPPASYLMKLAIKKTTSAKAKTAASKLKSDLQKIGLPVKIIGPAPNFYARKGEYYYWQLVVKSKNRQQLTNLAKHVPSGWTIDIDPINLL